MPAARHGTKHAHSPGFKKENRMTNAHWDPFERIDEAFSAVIAAQPTQAANEWRPATDISESEQEYLIRAELPAVAKDDVHVRAHHDTVTITGERRQPSEQNRERVHRIESAYGSFSRSFLMPADADTAAIHCEASHGVLTVHIPKKPVANIVERDIEVD
jgi:HSP20 family protein